eukprot:scaffold15321_cov116-Isochrysis_galbana.AAC.2
MAAASEDQASGGQIQEGTSGPMGCEAGGPASLWVGWEECFCNGAGGEDVWIGEPWVEAHGATMDNGRGGGKKPLGAHA